MHHVFAGIGLVAAVLQPTAAAAPGEVRPVEIDLRLSSIDLDVTIDPAAGTLKETASLVVEGRVKGVVSALDIVRTVSEGDLGS